MAAENRVYAPDQDGARSGIIVNRASDQDSRPDIEREEAWRILTGLLAVVTPEPAAPATQLLNRFGALNRILAAELDELVSVPEVSLEAALHLTRLHQALCFCLREKIEQGPLIGSMSQLDAYVRLRLGWKPREEGRLLLLDRKNHLLRDQPLAEGDVTCVRFTVRQVVETALRWGASAVIIVHNHPSGDPTPSQQDVEFTRDVAQALALIDIVLHDHVVVGRDRIRSMRSCGLL